MINEIQITPPVATYQSPARMPNLRKINFIFGANGTGKTTISRVIDQAEGHNHCFLNWQNAAPLQPMVYNRDFVDNNFNQQNPVQGVFTLGDNQVEAERGIALLQPELEKLTGQINSLTTQLNGEDGESGKNKELSDLEPALKEKCWKQKQLYDEYFQSAFSGVRGNAEKFKAKVQTEKASNKADLLTVVSLKEKAKTIFAGDIVRVSSLENLSADLLTAAELHPLLLKPIVGNQDVDIAALIEKLGNSDWIKQGRVYHEQSDNICPFCQQHTDEQFSNSLDSFFSEAYDNDIQALTTLFETYKSASERLLATVQRNIDSTNFFLNTELFEAEALALSERLKGNHKLLEEKIAEPSRKISLEPIEPFLSKLQILVNEANEATTAHNQTVANIASEKRKLTSEVWQFVLNELETDLNHYEQKKRKLNQAIAGMESSLATNRQKRTDLENQVKEFEKQSTSVQPTVDVINSLLRTFGFNSFKIQVASDGTHYRICRANGDDASHSLSEGEKTFITFLYFYSLIKGAQSASGVSTNRIVVFDDPISSLDSDILYIVSSLIKGVIEEVRQKVGHIKQVFVLTHNVYFHKEISFHKDRSQGNAMSDESFWIVKKQQQNSVIERCDENPIRSAYELLWQDVKPSNISSPSLQNTLRRILENYFTMWGGMGKNEICDLFEGREKLICQSLFSWVNDGSHSIHDDLYINHGEQTNEAYLRVFKEVFEKANQLGHYNMMIGSETAPAELIVVEED